MVAKSAGDFATKRYARVKTCSNSPTGAPWWRNLLQISPPKGIYTIFLRLAWMKEDAVGTFWWRNLQQILPPKGTYSVFLQPGLFEESHVGTFWWQNLLQIGLRANLAHICSYSAQAIF